MKRIRNKWAIYFTGILSIIFFFVFPLGMQDEITINSDFTIAQNEIKKNFSDVLYETENVNVWLYNEQTPKDYTVEKSIFQNKFTRIGKDKNNYQTIIVDFDNSEIGTVGGIDVHIDNFNYTLLSNNNEADEKLNVRIIPNGYQTIVNVNYTYNYNKVNFIKKTLGKWKFILSPNCKNEMIERISNSLKGYLKTE